MEQAWFDDLTLLRWLDNDDHEALARLFLDLPAERFVNLVQAIGERWGHWGGPLAHHAAPVLARHAPDLAWRCFAEPEGQRHRDAYAVLGIVGAVPLLPSETGRGLLAAIAEERLTLTAELLKHAADGRAGRAGENKVLPRPLVPLNGRMRPVREVVAHCRAAVTQNPDSIGDWVGLAYCYQHPATGLSLTDRRRPTVAAGRSEASGSSIPVAAGGWGGRDHPQSARKRYWWAPWSKLVDAVCISWRLGYRGQDLSRSRHLNPKRRIEGRLETAPSQAPSASRGLARIRSKRHRGSCVGSSQGERA
jgi:hypothetical protein